MKRIVTLIIASVFTMAAFAQDAPALKNAGNAALRSKNYQEAATQFESYFKVLEGKDKATQYNYATCAYKIKKYNKAILLYTKSIDDRYKVSSSYLKKAYCYKKLKKGNEMAATLEEGMKVKPGNRKIEKMYYGFYMKSGLALQKAGKLEKAAADFEKVLIVTNKKFRTDALYSLGALYSNKGASILEAARPMANKDKTGYATEKSKAKGFYSKAVEYLQEAANVDPSREDVKKTLEDAKKALI
jgi:pilus assembly protein Flp/PilA